MTPTPRIARPARGPARAAALALAALLAAACPQAAPRPAPATGAHRYGLVLLQSGVRPPIPKATADSMQAAHLANIKTMFEGGALDAAGPMGDDSPLIGLFVFHDAAPNLDSLLAPDPIVRAGRLRPELHTWITRGGLCDAYRRRKAIEPGRDSMVCYSFVLLKRGPRWTPQETPGLAKLLRRQADQVERWSERGGLRMAGPVEGTGELRGVYLFDADSAATAARVARDPAVVAGRLVAEVHPWWTAYGVVPGP